MVVYSLVDTDFFQVELFTDLVDLASSMEARFNGEIEIVEFNSITFSNYSLAKVRKMLKTVEAIDVYEDNLLSFVIRRHEL